MHPVSVTSAAVSSDVPERGDNSRDKEEEITAGSDIPGGGLQQVEVHATDVLAATASTTADVGGKGVSTKNRGKAPAQKHGAAASSSGSTIDQDVLSALGVALSPDSVQIIENLFFEVGAFAGRIYNGMVSKQLPSEKLPLTVRAIWYSTYRKMCEYVFVFMCLGEYHDKHRPSFIRALPRIKVLPDPSEHVAVQLTGDSLVGFLSRLDCAVRSKVEFIFNSHWNEVSVSLEGGALNDVSSKDFVSALDATGIPEVALSVLLANSTINQAIVKGKIKRTELGIITAPDSAAEKHTGVDGVTVSTRSEADSNTICAPVWIPPVSNDEGGVFDEDEGVQSSSVGPTEFNLLPSIVDSGAGSSSDPVAAEAHIVSDNLHVPVSTCSEAVIILVPVCIPIISAEAGVTSPSIILSELNLLPYVRDSSAGSSSDPTATERTADSDSVSLPVSKCSKTNIIRAPVWMPPVLNEGDDLRSVSIPSRIQCVDSMGVKLHSASAKLVHDLFCNIRGSSMKSLSRSIANYISIALSSELSGVGQAIWFRTYRELHLCSFMSRCFCVYHYRYRPAFIRAIADVGLLSRSPGGGLVPLIGGGLVDFLSRLDCTVRQLIETMFRSKWDTEAAKACSGLECGSLSDVVCQDFIKVADIAGIPMAALSVYYKYMRNRRYVVDESETSGKRSTVSKSKKSVSSSKITSEGTTSEGGITGLMHSSSLGVQLQTKLSSRPRPGSLPKRRLLSEIQLGPLLLLDKESDRSPKFIRSLFYKDKDQLSSLFATDVASNVSVSDESSSSTADDSTCHHDTADDVLVSTAEGVVSDLGVSEDDSSSSKSGSASVSVLYADVSPSSPESPAVLVREVGSTAEIVVYESGVLVDESTPASSSEQIIEPITTPSSVSAAIGMGESSTAAGNSSSSCFRGPKKLFVMRALTKGASEVPTSSGAVAGSSSSASGDVGNVQLVSAAEEEDVGVRLAALLNRGLPSSPPSASESSSSTRGGRGRLSSSSRQGSALRGSGRKRKRMS
ncbi:hypothetical protein [Candidatus Ichthyocystis sparus]|uniref:hypothetical protein n=1 Tax=Candidatus Ichthyocystis sparus TaxID=1561004 RepID=UPI000ACB465F|nr:hypothetical protein [Candidatus Ichthyocystis sparus]